MREIKTTSGETIKVYDETMPRINEYKFNTHLALEYGIGSDLQSIAKHYSNLTLWISQDKKEEAFQEIENLMINHQSMFDQVDHESRAFACLIHSIDGEENTDLSDDGLDTLIDKLPKIEKVEIRDIINQVKKKLSQN